MSNEAKQEYYQDNSQRRLFWRRVKKVLRVAGKILFWIIIYILIMIAAFVAGLKTGKAF